jgi:rfaE bifunctional protein kinase chain/domain
MKNVLVFGNFKAVHLGHFRLFEYARSLGNQLIVGIKVDEDKSANTEFSESLIKSIQFVGKVVKFTDIEKLLDEVEPDVVVRGQEFKNSPDQINELVRNRGIELFFGSGSTHLSEADFREYSGAGISVRGSFKKYIQAKDISREKLQEILKNLQGIRVTVVGDLIIDEYISCQAIGMSQEDPVVVSTPVGNSRFIGGAGIVAAHCKAMGAEVRLISLVGDDDASQWAEQRLSESGIATNFVHDSTRPTVVKQRYKNANHTLFRLTHFRAEEPDQKYLNQLISAIESSITQCDVLIFSDFSYGTLQSNVVKATQDFLRKISVKPIVTADSQSSSQLGSLSKFRGVDLITPTEYEARVELRNEIDGIAVLTQQLGKSLEVNSIVLKLGIDGVLIGGFQAGQESIPTDRIPSLNENPVDVSGAGDSLLAIGSLTIAGGYSLYESALMGSIAAGVQVSRRGNVPIDVSEMEEAIKSIFL